MNIYISTMVVDAMHNATWNAYKETLIFNDITTNISHDIETINTYRAISISTREAFNDFLNNI